MIYSAGNLNSYSYMSGFGGGSSGKIYIPVSPANVMYSQFDHISGYATSQGERGVSVSRVHILNSLIDQLVSIKKNPTKASIGTENLSDEQLDAKIKDYQSQIKASLDVAKNIPYALTPSAPTGIAVNIAA